MKVTKLVREYVHGQALAKVKAELESAKRRAKQVADDLLSRREQVRKYAEKLCLECEDKVDKYARQLGLTPIREVGGCRNRIISVNINEYDFEESYPQGDSPKRKAVEEILDEPERIEEAAKKAADELLFNLELGKVARKEIDFELAKLEVAL